MKSRETIPLKKRPVVLAVLNLTHFLLLIIIVYLY
jgi:hypothetical protein